MRTPEQILKESKVIAVVGLSDDPTRESHDVAAYLQKQGYRIIPVNPNANEILGEKSYRSLKDIPVPVDVVDVFRRSEHVVPIAEDAVAIRAKVLWLQLGVVNEEAAAIARAEGLDVVMDDCTKREHTRLKAAGRL